MLTLDDIARDPELAEGLPPDLGKRLLKQAAAVSLVILTHLEEESSATPTNVIPMRSKAEGDRDINADEIAKILGTSRRYVVRNAKSLPFIRRISKKVYVASEREVRRWRDHQRV